jgi:PST family polysaccharide transporter/lipopolysaccharide exporter
MSGVLARQTGSAVFWKSLQFGGVKVIFLARTLLLARLLVPEDFGLLAISLIAVDFLLSVTNLGMVPALVQHPGPDDRQYDVAWSIGVTRAALVSTVVFLAAPLIALWFEEPRAALIIRVLAARPLLDAAASIKIAELTRNLRFRTLAMLFLPEALANTAVSIALAPFVGVWALVAGMLAGPLILVVLSYLLAPHRPRFVLDASAASTLVRFGRWILLIGIVSVAARSTLQMVIARQLGAVELGLYYLAAKLAFIPAEISAEVVGTVAFPLYSRLQMEPQQVARAFRAIFTAVTALLLPICVLMVALAPGLVQHVLGARWAGTAPLIQVLALVNVAGLFGDTVSPLLKGLGQPYKLAAIELMQSTLLVGMVWWLTGRVGVLGAPLAWLIAVSFSQILSAYFIRHLLPKPFAGLGRSALAIILVCLAGGLTAWAITGVMPGVLGLAVATGAGLFLIVFTLLALDRLFAFGWLRDLSMAFPQVGVLANTAAAK